MINKTTYAKQIHAFLVLGKTLPGPAPAVQKDGNKLTDKVSISEEAKRALRSSSFPLIEKYPRPGQDGAVPVNGKSIASAAPAEAITAAAEKDPSNGETGMKPQEETESTSNSEVVVKADGSKVLMITDTIGGLEITMSVELSKPGTPLTTDTPDDGLKNQEGSTGEENLSKMAFSQPEK